MTDMANLIETNRIEGFSIYGVQMVDYTSDGVSGRDFGTAVALACFASTAAFEAETIAFADILRARQKKLSDLENALATLIDIMGKFDNDEPESDDTVRDDRLPGVRDLMARYGLSLNIRSFTLPVVPPATSETWYFIRRDDSENARANLEYAMDVEDNDLQQDMITMQGLVGKRDNSFSTAAKIIKKYGDTGNSMLRTIGQ